MSDFKSRLKELRTQMGISQEKLADMLGITKPAVSHYERGIRKPDLDMLTALCDIFNVSSDYLVGNTDVTLRFLNSSDIGRLANGSVRIPVLGYVAAGIPIDAIEDIVDWEEITTSMAANGKYFGLRIKGSSMEPRIVEGDTVIVRSQSDADSGDVVIVQVNGDQATCKRLAKYASGISLISFNPVYAPMNFTNEEIEALPVTIIGKVVENRQKY